MDDLEVEDQLIDGNLILSGKVLNGTSEETLSEVELADPVVGWDALIDPGLEEFESSLEICDIATEGLQGWVAL